MKKKSTEMAVLQAERFPSPNPDLGYSTAIPACTTNDLEEIPRGMMREKVGGVYKVPHPGNQVRKDGRA